MMQTKAKFAASAVALNLLVPSGASALGSECARISRGNLVRCALGESLRVRSEEHAVTASRARETAASPILPSNPELELLAARRSVPGGGEGLHWSARLSQQVEIGGQRGLRRAEASAGTAAEKQRLTLARRKVAASAWQAYFEIAAAERERQIAERMEAITHQVSDAAKAMSGTGVLSPVDSDLAEMSWSRARVELLSATRQARAAKLGLEALLGRDPSAPSPDVVADLAPLVGADAFARRMLGAQQADTPEAQAFDAERRAFDARARLMRRGRVPNLTLSVFAERDVFEGQLLGGAVSLPLPLLGPVGRTFAGEIAENEALAERAGTEATRVRREARVAISRALSDFDSRLAELDALGTNQVKLAEQNLDGLANQVRLGRIAVRDALLAQERLIEFLHARADAEHALCVASIELADAASYPLEEGQQ